MKSVLFGIAMTFLLGTVTPPLAAQANETFVCVADKATGFKFDKQSKTWDFARFNISDSKYTLSKSSDKWQWNQVGKSFPADCNGDFSDFGFLYCDQGFERISINKHTLRFQRVYFIGYVLSTGGLKSEGSDTPAIEIGRCSKL